MALYNGDKRIHELYNGDTYIEELYDGDTKIFDAGWDTTVSGASPITLPDARAKALLQNKLTGNTVRTITIDGVEYEVPSGYTLLEYIQSSGTQYIDTGIVPNINTKVEIKFKTEQPTGTEAIFGARNTSAGSERRAYILWKNVGTKMRFDFSTAQITATDSLSFTDWNIVVKDGANNYINGALQSTQTGSDFTITQSCYLFAQNTSDSVSSLTSAQVAYCKIWQDGTTLSEILIPAKNSSNVIGMYDFVSGRFFTNAGTGTFTAGAELPTPSANLGVAGTGDRTDNLFNPDNANTRYPNGWFSTGNVVSDAPNANRTVIIPCSEGDVFTFKHYTQASGARYFWIYSDTVASGEPCSAMYGTVISTNTITTTAAPSNAKYISICFWRSTAGTVQSAADDFVVVKGSTAPTAYIPYGYRIDERIARNCGMVDLGTLDIGKTAYGCSFEKSDMAQTETNAYITGYTLGRGDKTFRIVPVVSTVYVGIQDKRFADMTIEQIKELLSGKYLYYQRTTDSEWTAPATHTAYASAPLRKVGSYADTLDYASGTITRRVGVKVLDGTESWTLASSFKLFYFNITPTMAETPAMIYSTHFEKISYSQAGGGADGVGYFYCNYIFISIHQYDNDLAGFKSWLAAQYAAGTPVTVYYPLATPTTESITPVAVTPAKGTNYIESTNTVKASNVEAEYLKRTQ